MFPHHLLYHSGERIDMFHERSPVPPVDYRCCIYGLPPWRMASVGLIHNLSELMVIPLWWENGSHHYKATHLSGYVTGLGLSRLCITPSPRLKNLPWTASDISPITYQLSSHLFPSSLFCFLVLANQLSRCGYSLPTLLETKPPFS